MRSAAVTELMLVAGVGVKRRVARRRSTVHWTASVLFEFQKQSLWQKSRFWSL